MPHFPALDGWRGISILLVLAGHMFPLGPKRFEMNAAIAGSGMAIFFTLSGFLITSTLLFDPNVPKFLVRRFCRILPLIWLYTLIVFPLIKAPFAMYCAQLLFYANIPPFWLGHFNGHLWSVCVEMQFYVAVALNCLLLSRRGLLGLPLLCLAVTMFRIVHHEPMSIVTWFRVDEILAGATLALFMHLPGSERLRRLLLPLNPYVMIVLLVVASHDRFTWLQYARPYIAASLVGCTLVRPHGWFSSLLGSAPLRYMANISYALYVLHPITMAGWLGSGGTLVRYLKRPLCLALSFLFAHLSTRYYESFWIQLGKRWSNRFDSRSAPLRSQASVVHPD
ncbi:MAG: acyltransferase [Acidobacteria bacterium]|nr:acyltransferase [Acidobacteriota bacterium]